MIGEIGFTEETPESIIEPPFVRADNIFPRIKTLIENAQSEVLICLYKFNNNSDGGQMILGAFENLKNTAVSQQRLYS